MYLFSLNYIARKFHGPILATLPKGVMLLGAAAVSGCLLTERVSFEDSGALPPSVASAPSGPPLNQIVVLRRDVPAEEIPTSLSFEVSIRDANVNQELFARVFINDQPDLLPRPTPVIDRRVAASGSLERRFPFTLSTQLFPANACHKVELLVSGAFQDDPGSREPEEPGDLGLAVWWIDSRNQNNDPVDLGSCP